MTDKQPGTSIVTAATFLPVLDTNQAKERHNAVVEFVKDVLKDTLDYGKIPGVDKPTLLQPGAEKLITLFGLSPIMELIDKIEDWTGREHGGEQFFYYRYRCTMKRGDIILGAEEASANSWESKYRYRWIGEEEAKKRSDFEKLLSRDGRKTVFEPDFALTKKETTGQYGKPDSHWNAFEQAIADGTARRTAKKMGKKEYTGYEITLGEKQYRVPNPDIADVVNTVMQIAEKRAKIRATRSCTGASQFFTQDVEDLETIQVERAPAATKPATNDTKVEDAVIVEEKKREQKPAEQSGVGASPAAAKAASSTAPAGRSAEHDDADWQLKFKEAANIVELTQMYNQLPADKRRPGTKLFEAFKARRKELGVKDEE